MRRDYSGANGRVNWGVAMPHGARAVDEPHPRRNHGGMKRIVLALFLIWAGPAAGQVPPTDWRTLVDARELDRIENWERHFAEALRRVANLEARYFHDIDRAGLADLARTTQFRWPARPAERMAMCRLVQTAWHHTSIGERHACRFRLDRESGSLSKHTGEIQFDIRMFPDRVLGAVVIGEWWTSAELGPRRVRGPERRFVGVMRQRDDTTLHFLLASGDNRSDIPIVELGHRLPS